MAALVPGVPFMLTTGAGDALTAQWEGPYDSSITTTIGIGLIQLGGPGTGLLKRVSGNRTISWGAGVAKAPKVRSRR